MPGEIEGDGAADALGSAGDEGGAGHDGMGLCVGHAGEHAAGRAAGQEARAGR
jgi:hypothetical protein